MLQLPGYHVNWSSPSKSNRETAEDVRLKSEEFASKSENSEETQTDLTDLTASLDLNPIPSEKGSFSEIVRALVNSLSFNPDSCDHIINQEGDDILAKVTEIGLDVIKYKRCDYLDGPTYSIPKSSVLLIEYSNGTREIIKAKQPEKKQEPDYSNVDDVYKNNNSDSRRRRVEGLGLAGFIITLVNLPLWWLVSQIFGIVAGVLGIIFGSIGIHRCRKNPDTKWGMGFAVTSLVVGLVMVLVSLIFLLILL